MGRLLCNEDVKIFHADEYIITLFFLEKRSSMADQIMGRHVANPCNKRGKKTGFTLRFPPGENMHIPKVKII
jgi:hypothetical protein